MQQQRFEEEAVQMGHNERKDFHLNFNVFFFYCRLQAKVWKNQFHYATWWWWWWWWLVVGLLNYYCVFSLLTLIDPSMFLPDWIRLCKMKSIRLVVNNCVVLGGKYDCFWICFEIIQEDVCIELGECLYSESAVQIPSCSSSQHTLLLPCTAAADLTSLSPSHMCYLTHPSVIEEIWQEYLFIMWTVSLFNISSNSRCIGTRSLHETGTINKLKWI